VIADVSQPLQLFDHRHRVIRDEPADVPKLKPAVARKVVVAIVRWDVALVIPLILCANPSDVAHVEGTVIRQIQMDLWCEIVARFSSKIGIDLQNLAEVGQRLLAVGRPNLTPPHVDLVFSARACSPLRCAAKQQLEMRVHGVRGV
jgi:hypothetical protein